MECNLSAETNPCVPKLLLVLFVTATESEPGQMQMSDVTTVTPKDPLFPAKSERHTHSSQAGGPWRYTQSVFGGEESICNKQGSEDKGCRPEETRGRTNDVGEDQVPAGDEGPELPHRHVAVEVG